MNHQIDIFNDVYFVCYFSTNDDHVTGYPVFGPYYCLDKANDKLITLLSSGICAWVTHDVRKTQFWRFEKSLARRSRPMEKMG